MAVRYKGGGACRLSSAAPSGACAFRLLMFGFVDQSVADAAGAQGMPEVIFAFDRWEHPLSPEWLCMRSQNVCVLKVLVT